MAEGAMRRKNHASSSRNTLSTWARAMNSVTTSS